MTETTPAAGSPPTQPMLHLSNDAVAELLSMEETMEALRIGFSSLADNDAAHVPRLELWSPAAQSDAYYCLGSMAGTVKHFGITAIRIKSDVLYWPDGRRQEKYAVEPGTYCGFILLFSSATGAPLAMINDGVLQRMRVGGSAGIGADYLANPEASSLGILGSGDMARTYLEAIALTRRLDSVKVYSPTAAHREAYAIEMSEELGLAVTAVESAEEAVSGAEIVATATNAMAPTIEPDWVTDGALVLCVTRREVGPELVDRFDRVFQLGEFTIGSDSNVPNLEWPQSGAGGFVAGNEEERSRLPWKGSAEGRRFPSLIDLLRGEAEERGAPDETVLFINTGLQGIQFAAVAARTYQLALERQVGEPMRQDRFLQQIRD